MAQGKAGTEKICSQCHGLARYISRYKDSAGWEATFEKLVASGREATNTEIQAVVDDLATHSAVETVSRFQISNPGTSASRKIRLAWLVRSRFARMRHGSRGSKVKRVSSSRGYRIIVLDRSGPE